MSILLGRKTKRLENNSRSLEHEAKNIAERTRESWGVVHGEMLRQSAATERKFKDSKMNLQRKKSKDKEAQPETFNGGTLSLHGLTGTAKHVQDHKSQMQVDVMERNKAAFILNEVQAVLTTTALRNNEEEPSQAAGQRERIL